MIDELAATLAKKRLAKPLIATGLTAERMTWHSPQPISSTNSGCLSRIRNRLTTAATGLALPCS